MRLALADNSQWVGSSAKHEAVEGCAWTENELPACHARDAVSSPTEAHYRYASAAELGALGALPDEDWLSPRERGELATWRHPRRRQEWLWGRMLGKQLIAERMGAWQASEIEILSRDAAGRVNRPLIYGAGQAWPWSLSIAHTERGALAALSCAPHTAVGVDIAVCASLGDGLTQLWFTPAEQQWLRRSQSSAVGCFIWAAKEALYKACSQGEGFNPRQFEVLPEGACRYRGAVLEQVRLRAWSVDGQIAVIATVGIESQTACALR